MAIALETVAEIAGDPPIADGAARAGDLPGSGG